MAGSAGGGDGEISGINVTPLVDIMLVLVIILMVSAEFSKYRTVPIALPKVNAAAMKQEPQKVALTIKKDGNVYINDKKVKSLKKLKLYLKTKKKLHPEIAVILRAEGDVKYKRLLYYLDEVKAAGIAKVGLAVDKKKKKKRRI